MSASPTRPSIFSSYYTPHNLQKKLKNAWSFMIADLDVTRLVDLRIRSYPRRSQATAKRDGREEENTRPNPFVQGEGPEVIDLQFSSLVYLSVSAFQPTCGNLLEIGLLQTLVPLMQGPRFADNWFVGLCTSVRVPESGHGKTN
jgi:hypothetical protein